LYAGDFFVPLKGVLFIGLFAFCAVGALVAPCLGVYGYVADYCIGPANAWWARPFSGLGLRYSFILAIMTAAGTLLHRSNLRYGARLLCRQENYLVIFLLLVWLSVFIAGDISVRYVRIDHPSIKLTKIFIFSFLMTHIITERRKLDGLFWVLVLASLILGLQAWDTPRRAFSSGRLEGVGGADFTEANYFSAFMATMLPIIGIQFFRCRNFIGKILCAVSAAFTANAVVLCRSRGAFLGIAIGVLTALTYAPERYRKKILVCLILGMLGGLYVVDDQFLGRITTITNSEENRDKSAQSRLDIWQGGLRMVIDHPLGVGAGNWYENIGNYIPTYGKMDSHNTFVKCIAELGIQGVIIFVAIIIIAYRSLGWFKRKRAPAQEHDELVLMSFALKVSLTILLTCCITMTLLYAEFLWLLLCLPICLNRCVDNAILDADLAQSKSAVTERTSKIKY
jgi:O-antigen ligase